MSTPVHINFKKLRIAEDKLNYTKRQIEKFQATYDKESARLDKLKVLVDKMDYSRKKLSVERRSLKESISRLVKDTKDHDKKRLNSYKKLRKVQEDLKAKEALLTTYDIEIAKKKEESKDLTLDISDLRKDLKKRRVSVESELSEAKTRLGDVFAMIQQKQTTISILDTNIKELLSRNEELHARNDVLQKSLEQIDSTLKAKVNLCENEIAKQNDASKLRLKNDKEKLSKIYRDIEKRQKHIFNLKDEEKLLTIRLEKLKENIAA